MPEKPTLLWLGEGPPPESLRSAAGGDWNLQPTRLDVPLAPQLTAATIAAVRPNGHLRESPWIWKLLHELDRSPAVAVFMLPEYARGVWSALDQRKGQFLCIRDDAPHEELAVLLRAAAALQPSIRDLQTELTAARAGRRPPGQSYEELDEEMRLAARLQRDFLPRRLPEIGPVRFGVLYRPAGWVSGDLYDVARLDETHLGFYVVDAVGHGMPAALFTMFVKTALITKRIAGSSYQIVPPHTAMNDLNAEICGQNFSTFPFCTCVYCVLDVRRLSLTYCRAGHPEPLRFRADGRIEKLPAVGSLLGVFPAEQYQSFELALAPGDRLMLYTDGAEVVLRGPHEADRPLEQVLAPWAHLSQEEILLQISARIESLQNDQPIEDDITIVTLQVAG